MTQFKAENNLIKCSHGTIVRFVGNEAFEHASDRTQECCCKPSEFREAYFKVHPSQNQTIKQFKLDPKLNSIKVAEERMLNGMLDKDQKIMIQNEELQAVSELTYEQIADRSQALSIEIEIRNEKRQALRLRMSEIYEEADEERRAEYRKHSIVPASFRETESNGKAKKKISATPEEKREKKINATMLQFNLTREKAVKYLQTLEED